mmetsp:Transcript_85592/g.135770  ORF Transcript_85592/g.135770 Transcript_85592/m.135770 type:complete len:221 (+) Transcript_85592:282-944(+)
MPDGFAPSQERLPQSHLGIHVEIIAATLEGLMFGHLQRQDHGTRDDTGPLIRHPREGEALAVAHPFFNLGIDHCHLLFTLLFTGDFLLLLHEHARTHLTIHHPHFIGATTTSLTLGTVGLNSAAAAHDPSLDLGSATAAVVEVLETHSQIGSCVFTFLNFTLFRLFDGLHPAGVVEDLFVRIVEDLVRIPNFSKFPLGLFIRIFVRMILDGQLSIDLLDV